MSFREKIARIHPMLFILPPLLALWVILFFLSKGMCDPGDGLNHYLFARYAFDHPGLLLHHWAKPVFTLVYCLPAQAGYAGAVMLNIVCSGFTVFFAWKTANLLGMRQPCSAALLTAFAPVFFTSTMSGLTEPLFAFVLLLSVYLLLRQYRLAALILVSFLPFVRTEGFLMLPLFALVLMIRRKWYWLPLLATGTVVYTIIGGIYYDDFLWVIHLNPYQNGAAAIYGSGSLFFFAYNLKSVLGWSLILLAAAGLGVQLSRMRKRSEQMLLEETLLIFGSVIVLVGAHSIFWWKGLYGSMGLLRVVAAIVPLAALMAARGWSSFVLRFENSRKLILLTGIFFLAIQCWMPFRYHDLPFQASAVENTATETRKWVEEHLPETPVLFCHDPYYLYISNRDPFDYRVNRNLTLLQPKYGPPPAGSLVVWDSHFGPAEAGLPLDVMNNDSRIELLKKIHSSEDDTEYRVYRVK